MAENRGCRVHLQEHSFDCQFALELNEVIAAAKAAEFMQSALGPAFAAPGIAIVFDGNPVTLSATAIKLAPYFAT